MKILEHETAKIHDERGCNMKKIWILAFTLIFLLGSSGLAYAASKTDDLNSVFKKYPFVENYINELLNRIQTLTNDVADREATINNLKAENEQLKLEVGNLTDQVN